MTNEQLEESLRSVFSSWKRKHKKMMTLNVGTGVGDIGLKVEDLEDEENKMSMFTIKHKDGEVTINVNDIELVKKTNAHKAKMIGGECDGTVTSHEDSYLIIIRNHPTYFLTEEQYRSVLDMLAVLNTIDRC